jgi:hypothetical protein
MDPVLRIGMVGLDTSHCTAFLELLHRTDHPYHVPGGRVVAAVPDFSEAMAVSRNRVEGFRKTIEAAGVAMVGTIEELRGLDAYFLENVDGRQHADRFERLAAFGKPIFVDKPLACSVADARRIQTVSQARGAPVFSTSSLRYAAGIADGAVAEGTVRSCEAFGPMGVLDDFPRYFWYGIHSADVLFSKMGRGCRSVRAISLPDADLLVGVWEDGRLGSIRGNRFGQSAFGFTLWTEKTVRWGLAAAEPPYYACLLRQVIPFFQTGRAPVSLDETIEVVAFLEAAEKSRIRNSEAVALSGE